MMMATANPINRGSKKKLQLINSYLPLSILSGCMMLKNKRMGTTYLWKCAIVTWEKSSKKEVKYW